MPLEQQTNRQVPPRTVFEPVCCCSPYSRFCCHSNSMSAECIVNELMSSEVNLSFKAKLMLHHDVWEEEGKMDLLSLDENDVKRQTCPNILKLKQEDYFKTLNFSKQLVQHNPCFSLCSQALLHFHIKIYSDVDILISHLQVVRDANVFLTALKSFYQYSCSTRFLPNSVSSLLSSWSCLTFSYFMCLPKRKINREWGIKMKI